MSESSNRQVNDRAIVIQRGFELSEFNALLAKLGVPTKICSGALPTAEQLCGAAVVVIPGKRLAESGKPNLSLWPRTVAVVDDSRQALLRRSQQTTTRARKPPRRSHSIRPRISRHCLRQISTKRIPSRAMTRHPKRTDLNVAAKPGYPMNVESWRRPNSATATTARCSRSKTSRITSERTSI